MISVLPVHVRIRRVVLRVLLLVVTAQQLARPIVRCAAAARMLIVLHANRVKKAIALHVHRAVIQLSVRHVHRAVIRHARHVQPTAALTVAPALTAVARQSQSAQVM